MAFIPLTNKKLFERPMVSERGLSAMNQAVALHDEDSLAPTVIRGFVGSITVGVAVWAIILTLIL